MGVGAGLYMCDVVVKSSRSLSHLLMSSCYYGNTALYTKMHRAVKTGAVYLAPNWIESTYTTRLASPKSSVLSLQCT